VETSRHQQDLMADAIAVRLTGDAGSLHSAITKLAQSNREPGSDPSVGKYLFVGPQAGDALISLKFHHAPVVLQTGRGSLVAERLENLEMVMDGRWRPFDRPEGD